MYANLEEHGGNFRLVNTGTLGVTFMGEVMNWLAAGRLYLESEEASIARFFGEDSQQLQTHMQKRSEVFDSNPGYRFTYGLRNYAQHSGLPVSGISVSRNPDGSTAFELYLSKAQLLSSHFNWSKPAMKLLTAWDEQILLLPLIEEAMDGYCKIEDDIRGSLMERCGGLVRTLREGIARIGETPGHPAIIRCSEADGPTTFPSFPPSSGLGRLESALADADPVSAFWRNESDPNLSKTPEMLQSQALAAAVIGAWIEDPDVDLRNVIEGVLQGDRNLSPVLWGLVSVSGFLLIMLAKAIGSTPEALLGSFLADDHDPDDNEDESPEPGADD